MAGIILLIGLCVVMALASFLAGALPLSLTLSQSQLRFLSSAGVGILVGTALIVIIPEGIEASMSPSETSHSHRMRALVRRSPWSHAINVRAFEDTVPTIRTVPRDIDSEVDAVVRRIITPKREQSDASVEKKEEPVEGVPATGEPESPPEDSKADKEAQEHEKEHEQDGDHQDEHAHEHVHVPAFEIGFALILGFLLMFLIDRLPRHATESLQSGPQMRHVSLDNLGGSGSTDDESDGFLGSLAPGPKHARSLATTTGLVIHAAADGIAMGASATTSDMKLGFIIFAAIMIHKAPAAFGLTALLLKQGLSKRAARGHLIVFSLAAPFGALTTWLLITLLGSKNAGSESDHWWTGMLLLFSGGTFLYVAMHAMQEDSSPHSHGMDHGANGYAEGTASTQRKAKGPQMRDTVATIVGMLVPLLTQFGHHH